MNYQTAVSRFGKPYQSQGTCEFCNKDGPTWHWKDLTEDFFETCADCYQLALDAKPVREAGEGMTIERWNELSEHDSKAELTREEWDLGWHFCNSEWDGLLIGPGMGEFKHCNCAPTTWDEAHANV